MLSKLFRFPVLNIVIILIITVIFGFGIVKIRIDSDVTEMLPKNNKAYMDNKKINEIYGTGDTMIIGLKSKRGDILTIQNIQTIKQMTKDIETIKLPDKESNKQTQMNNNDNYDALFENLESEIINDPISDGQDNNRPFQSIDVIDKVTSIANLEIIEGVEGGIKPVLMEDLIPENENDLLYFKQKLLSWDFFKGIYYSEDFSSSAITIIFKNNVEDSKKSFVYDELIRIINNQNNPDLEYNIAGKMVVMAVIVKAILKDLYRLVPFVIILLIILLLISFKKIRNVALILITVIIATCWTLGIMGFLGIKLTMIGVIIPVLLIAIGSAYGIHIITHYIEDKNQLSIDSKKDNKEIIIKTVLKTVFPVFLASLTTFFGFISLITMKIVAIKDFGIFVSIGVIIEFILSIILIPSIIILLKPQKEKIQFNKENTPYLELALIKLTRFLKNRKPVIIIGFIISYIILINGLTKVQVDLDTLKFFKKDSQIVQSTRFIDKHLAGADTIYLNIIGQKDGDLAHPDILKAMDDLSVYLIKKYEVIGAVVGFNDMIKRMNQVMHYPDNEEYQELMKSSITYEDFLKIANKIKTLKDNRNPKLNDTISLINKIFNYNGEAYNEIPFDPEKYQISDEMYMHYADENNIEITNISGTEEVKLKKEILKQLISQYLLLYSGNLGDLIQDDQLQPKMAKLNISLKMTKSSELKIIVDDIKDYIQHYFPEGYDVQFGGTTMISNELNNIVISGQILSFIMAILIVFIIITISFRSFIAGLISTIPIINSILINFAIMGYFNLDLNIATALIASLSIGIGIDYTIHFLSFYKENYKKNNDINTAIEKTFYTTGKAILYNAVSVGLGFAVLVFSSTSILGVFGILVAIVMFSSSIGALTILPVILEMFNPKFVKK